MGLNLPYYTLQLAEVWSGLDGLSFRVKLGLDTTVFGLYFVQYPLMAAYLLSFFADFHRAERRRALSRCYCSSSPPITSPASEVGEECLQPNSPYEAT